MISLTPATVAVILFAGLFLLIILRIPISFALALAALPVLLFDARVSPLMLMQRMMNGYSSFVLLAVPFFILAANVMNSSGITDRLIRFSKSLVGALPGGLAHVNVLVSMFFAGISGSSTADAAGIGSILIPAMVREKYDKNFSVAVTACSSVMGVVIPPSIIMIIWGGVSNISVAALFLAGIVPGILIGVSQMIIVLLFAWKRKYPIEAKLDFREIAVSFKGSIWAGFAPFIVIGGIVGGIVTPTEASLTAVVYALLVGMLVYHTVKVKDVPALMLKTAKLASLSLFAVGTASIYGWVLAYFNIATYIVNAMGYITSSPLVMLFIIVGFFLVVGTFMDGAPAIVILAPLLRPLADYAGIHPLHFSIASVIALSFGLITPPYGLCLLIASEVAGINSMDAVKEVGIFLLAMLVVLVLIILFPGISLFIPQMIVPNLM
jgi:tripartite ATP-independent transporter DctM subunit